MCDPCLFKSGMHLDADRIQRIIESDRAERARPAAERAEIKMTARLRARELHSAGLSVREIENQLASENLPGKKSAISEWPRKAS